MLYVIINVWSILHHVVEIGNCMLANKRVYAYVCVSVHVCIHENHV